MKQILLDWKRNRHSVCAVALYVSAVLGNVGFSGEAQALTLTYNYVGPQLTIPGINNSFYCPASVGNITATATSLGYLNYNNTVNGFGYSSQYQGASIELGANGEVTNSSMAPPDVVINNGSTMVSLSQIYGNPNLFDSLAIYGYLASLPPTSENGNGGGFDCQYTYTTAEQGTWNAN